MTDLTLELPNFEGPLDLLLHLIRSQKIDIYDIPIAQITSQYLAYLQKMQELDLQIAGEYFVMSSTLLRIKSQYLLPKNDFSQDDADEADDPRQELVEQLLQYSVFKKISNYLKTRNDQIPITAAKEASVQKDKGLSPLPLGQISTSELANTFALVVRRYKLQQPEAAAVHLTSVSITELVDWLKQKLSQQKQISFFSLLPNLHSLDEVVGLFLAVLSLCKDKFLRVQQSQTFGDLNLERVQPNGE
jgi:segregation and condensation protein A